MDINEKSMVFTQKSLGFTLIFQKDHVPGRNDLCAVQYDPFSLSLNFKKWGLNKLAIVNVTDNNFGNVIQNEKLVLVDFWATWCGPCKMMAPVLEELASDYDGKLTVAKLDVDQNPQTAAQFGIMSIPTMIVFKEGQPVKQLVGYMPKEYLEAQIKDIF